MWWAGFFFSFFLNVLCAEAPASPVLSASIKEKILHIYNWADYLPQSVIEKFQEETGIQVVYDVFDSPELLDAKLLAARSGYDVVFPSAFPDLTRQIPAGLYLPLDFSKIPNAKNLDPILMERLNAVDPGHRYAIPYLWGTTGFAYNEASLKQCLDDAPTDSLALLFDKETLKKLASCGVSLLDSPIEVFPAALIYLGLDPNTEKLEDLKKATLLLTSLLPYIRKFDSFQFVSQLANKELAVAQTWSSYGNMAAIRAREAKNSQNVHYVIPKEGGFMWIDVMAIPKDAPHREHAHAFINFLLDPKIQAEITNMLYTANSVPQSKKFVKTEILNNQGIYPTEEVVEKLFIDEKKQKIYQRRLFREWMKVKTGI